MSPKYVMSFLRQLRARAESEVDRVSALVRTLADASGITLGGLELQLSQVDFRELLVRIGPFRSCRRRAFSPHV